MTDDDLAAIHQGEKGCHGPPFTYEQLEQMAVDEQDAYRRSRDQADGHAEEVSPTNSRIGEEIRGILDGLAQTGPLANLHSLPKVRTTIALDGHDNKLEVMFSSAEERVLIEDMVDGDGIVCVGSLEVVALIEALRCALRGMGA